MNSAGNTVAQVALLLALSLPMGLAENMDPSGDDSQYAYGENIGWLNGEPGGDGGDGIEVTDFRLTGWMWSENAGWISLGCENNGSCEDTRYGIANDGQGKLSGYAFSENLGWIDFGAEGAGVLIDPANGVFSGRAWSENTGWISFAPESGNSFSMVTSWSCTTSEPITQTPALSLSLKDSVVQITWPAVAFASAYDTVRGNLAVLRNTGGDFSLAADACLASKQEATTSEDDEFLAPGEGRWYLVRAANCHEVASYDSGGPAQVATRDAGLEAAAAACR